MKLQRQEAASKYNGKHRNINTYDKDSVINYLNDIEKYLNNYEYESNSDFIFCGRKKFIYDEVMEIMNRTKSVDNPVYFVLGSLEEFISDNNDVHISNSNALGMSFSELRDANDRYISTGVICLEEKKYINSIIDRIKDEINSLNQNKKISLEQDNNYMDTFDQENVNFISMLNNKGMFHLSISSGVVVPMNHPKYYEGRKNIVLDKDEKNNYIGRRKIEIGKDKYNIDESVIDEVIGYTKTNFDKLIDVAENQSIEMYDGVSHNIDIKIGSIYLTLSELNTKTEEDRLFLNDFESKIIEILTYPRCPICKEKLNYMMPDGTTLCCNSCNKYFTNENGKVGKETSYPYMDHNADY